VTQPGKAFYIGRITHFAPEQQPLTDKTVQQLREKYGPESISSNGPVEVESQFYSPSSISIDWVFDKTGKQRGPKQITDTGGDFQTCAHYEHGHYPNGIFSYEFHGGRLQIGALRAPVSYSPDCGIALKGRLALWSNPHLLPVLFEELVGDSIAVDDIQKLMAEAKAAQEQQRQQQEQKASGVKPPL
jgi:hypothetical protein